MAVPNGNRAMTARFSSLRNAAAMLLVAVALLLQAVTPQGWMMGEDASGTITIEVCNSDQQLVIPLKGKTPAHQDDDSASKACAFAGLQHAGIDNDPNLSLPLPSLALAAYDGVREQALAPETPRFLPPARGPPTFA